EQNPDYWYSIGRSNIIKARKLKAIEKEAKNVILFVGDGLGISTLTAARILKGQLDGKSGEESNLWFENFPYTALIKTYNVDRQVPDSAATATAFLCGVKANYETLKVNAKVKPKETNCDAVEANKIKSIMDWAIEAGKSTGIVTTTRVTHATPAAAYASISYRYWENNAELPVNVSRKCKDITRQLIEDEPGSKINVILGGGLKNFLNNTFNDSNSKETGKRTDGLDLIKIWKEMRSKQKLNFDQFRYVSSAKDLRALNSDKIQYLLGLFNYDHMSYDRERDKEEEPSLAEMTEAAIKVLSKNSKGYVLMIEGGRIDHAHHQNFGNMALYETLAMDAAVETANKLTSDENTLIVVTADHSHTLTINGYPKRGQSIFGYFSEKENDSFPYTVLMYTNGPGFKDQRSNPLKVNTSALRYRQHAAVYVDEAAHAGEDVAVYSQGPMAHLFHGLKEQSYVAHVMAYASCIWIYSNETHCSQASNITSKKLSVFMFAIYTLIYMLFVCF
ncbi:Alkaline phosphatase: tissue-nonspecific isozyme-like protein, partial [Dinothrombium tinctorium]